MKRLYLIGILVLLIIIAGAIIMSPVSPLNKVNVNGETIKLTSGYTVKNSTENSLTITNNTNELIIASTKLTNDLEAAVSGYTEKIGDNYNVTTSKLEMNTNQEVIKTEAASKNDTLKITKYWFVHDGTTYEIQTTNAQEGTDDVVRDLINSF
jgi:hypothetical protein